MVAVVQRRGRQQKMLQLSVPSQMAARLGRMAASMAVGAARTAMAASSRVQAPSAALIPRTAPVCSANVRALRTPLHSTTSLSLRSFSVAASAAAPPSTSSSNVIDVVREELGYEKENYTKPEVMPICIFTPCELAAPHLPQQCYSSAV